MRYAENRIYLRNYEEIEQLQIYNLIILPICDILPNIFEKNTAVREMEDENDDNS